MSFDYLVDVAVQAKRDGFVSEIIWGNTLDIMISTKEYPLISVSDKVSEDFILDAVKIINSLYKDEFIIYEEEDILKVNNNAVIELSNGNMCTVENVIKDLLEISVVENERFLNFLTLKGAKVTQKREQ